MLPKSATNNLNWPYAELSFILHRNSITVGHLQKSVTVSPLPSWKALCRKVTKRCRFKSLWKFFYSLKRLFAFSIGTHSQIFDRKIVLSLSKGGPSKMKKLLILFSLIMIFAAPLAWAAPPGKHISPTLSRFLKAVKPYRRRWKPAGPRWVPCRWRGRRRSGHRNPPRLRFRVSQTRSALLRTGMVSATSRQRTTSILP